MPLVSLALPSGIVNNGTEYESSGRYYDCNLVRFDPIRPYGGWRKKQKADSTNMTDHLTGMGRCCIAGTDNSTVTRLYIGTEQELKFMTRGAALTDITPAGFPHGTMHAYASGGAGGYGAGPYGVGSYGTPRPDSSVITDATMWTMGLRGANLIACAGDGDGRIYEYTPGDPAAVVVTNAPTGCRGVFVTPERFVMALGSGGDPRLLQWCDQENDTIWAPLATNQAGNFPLQTGGRLMQGVGAKDYSLITTDIDAWVGKYIQPPLVYGFERVGQGCGAVSQGCATAIDTSCYWMGRNQFFTCNGGFVEVLPCDVLDHVFSDFNRQQQSLVTCSVLSEANEITWRYPSASSSQPDGFPLDRFVTYNYHTKIWSTGKLLDDNDELVAGAVRLSGIDRGIFSCPLAVGQNGYVYEHEVGLEYNNITPYLRGGPLEIGNGDNVGTALRFIPDEKTIGDVTITFYTRMFPNGEEKVVGPYVASETNDVRFTARQVAVKYRMHGQSDFRVGDNRIDVTPGGRR